MIRKLLRLLGVRREIQRRLDVNLEFDDLDGGAADVRNGARLALVALRSWIDGCDGAIGPPPEPVEAEDRTNWSDPEEDDESDSELVLPWIEDAKVGQECFFCIEEPCGDLQWLSRGDVVARTDWIDSAGDRRWFCTIRYSGVEFDIASVPM